MHCGVPWHIKMFEIAQSPAIALKDGAGQTNAV